MSANLTVDSMRAILGREVEEIHLTVAKASAMGLDPETIANATGLSREEVGELIESQDYKDVRLLVGSQMLSDRVESDATWDGIENSAVKKLAKRLELERDTDTLLRIAAVANRATRRMAPPKEAGPLDPSQAGARVPLTLTKRYTEKLNGDGSVERTETQQISVLDGSAVNPKFDEIKGMLQGGQGGGAKASAEYLESLEPVGGAPKLPAGSTDSAKGFSMDELLRAAKRVR